MKYLIAFILTLTPAIAYSAAGSVSKEGSTKLPGTTIDNTLYYTSGAAAGYWLQVQSSAGDIKAVPGSALPTDPVNIGINVRQNSSTSGQDFARQGSNGYWYISYAGLLNYLPGGTATAWTGTENLTQIVLPISGTIKNLGFIGSDLGANGCSNNGSGDRGIRVTVRVNGVDSALTCDCLGTNKTCTDTSNQVSVSAGDKISLYRSETIATGTSSCQNGTVVFQFAF